MRDKEMIAVFHYDDGGSNRCGAEPYRYAEEIVRCKDCIENDINISGTENWCLHFGYDVEDDGFCNYGERVDEPNYYDPALHE